MAISAQAKAHHVSTLAVTDPELIEAFDDFEFDEELQHGEPRTLTALAAIVEAAPAT